MKKYILAVTLILIFHACSKYDNNPAFELERPITMTVFCPNAPDDTIRQTDYEYDSENLTKMTQRNYGEITSVTNYEYNSKNLLAIEKQDQIYRITEITYYYNKSDQIINKLYKTSDIDPNGLVTRTTESEAPLEYKNNLLVKEVEYWGGWNTYEYEKGKLITKNVFTISGQLNRIIKYKYTGSLKVEEKNQTSSGDIVYIRTFEYDSENRLAKIIEDGNVIEQNIYDGNMLLEKRMYYFGIDPGFSACNGNFIYKYQYQ